MGEALPDEELSGLTASSPGSAHDHPIRRGVEVLEARRDFSQGDVGDFGEPADFQLCGFADIKKLQDAALVQLGLDIFHRNIEGVIHAPSLSASRSAIIWEREDPLLRGPSFGPRVFDGVEPEWRGPFGGRSLAKDCLLGPIGRGRRSVDCGRHF